MQSRNSRHAKISIVLVVFVLFALVSCKKDNSPANPGSGGREVVPMRFASKFYPSDPAALSSMIKSFFEMVPDAVVGDTTLGFMTPHSGYVYSGPIAAFAFKSLPQGRYKRVVILFPSHFTEFRGILAVDQDAFATPMGEVEIDRDAVRKLIAADPSIFWKEGVLDREYACETLLPFLKERLGSGFKVIPIMMGDQSPNMTRRLAEILQANIGTGSDTLYLASTDMSHGNTYETANALDVIALNQIVNLDFDALAGDLGSGRAQMCGYGPAMVLMRMSKSSGAEKAKILKHLNSFDTTGAQSGVVGYGAVQFYKK